MKSGFSVGCLLLGFTAVYASAQPPLHPLIVNVTSNVPAGSALYVAVDRPELGSLTTTGAVRLVNLGGNQWTGAVAVLRSTADSAVPYKFLTRTTNSSTHCSIGNGDLGGPTLTATVPVWDPGYAGKTLYYHSAWTNVSVLYRVSQTSTWLFSPVMTRVGDGRTPGEHRYRVSGIGEPGQPLEFVMRGFLNGVEQWDNPSVGGVNNNYYTSLDFLFLQDKQIYNYVPPAAVSAPQVLSVANWPSSYTANGIPSRGGRIYLPRGYAQNTEKRYPVLYLHDGQNVFDPGGPFGSWSAEAAATREIAQGRMRETIIVAVNNTASRMSEYGTPQDGRTGDFYLRYLIDNVKTVVDATYRTLPDFMDTGVMGSSLGGLISAYIGLSTNVFGLVGAVSPSYWYGPNFRNWIQTQPTKGNRIYQDAGTEEGSSMWDHFWPVYGFYVRDGYIVNDDLLAVIGCGQGHNEAAWANRVPTAFRFLFHPWDEPNELDDTPPPPTIPDLVITNPPGDLAVGEEIATVDLAGVANPDAWQVLAWTNALTGDAGTQPVSTHWSVVAVPLGVGDNEITVSARSDVPVFDQHASDQSTDPAYSGGWSSGSNGGFGFGPWSLFTNGFAGRFIGADGWGLWAQTNHLSEAVRPFVEPFSVGRRFRATIRNGWVLEGLQSVGMALRDAGGESRIQFYFAGGDAHYTLEDAGGPRSTGISWTDQSQAVEIERMSDTEYVLRAGGVVLNGTFDGALVEARFWNWSGGPGSNYDFYFDQPAIVSVGSTHSSTSVTVTVTRAGPELHDGIPLRWWNEFGLGTNSTADADVDEDGSKNREEWVADTNPTNALSVFPREIRMAEGFDVVTFQVGPPTSNRRVYDVWRCTDILGGEWNRMNLNRPGADDGGPVFLSVTNQGGRIFYQTGVSLP